MKSINITLDIYNIAINFIILLAIYTSKFNKEGIENFNKTRRWYRVISIINLVMSGIDIFIRAYEGAAKPVNFTILPIALFLYYLAVFLLLCSSAKCIMSLLDHVRAQKKGRKIFSGLLIFCLAAYCGLLLSTQFTPLLYEIDQNNIYSRGNFFFLAIAVQAVIYADLVWYMHINRKTIHPLKIIIVAFFIFFPQLAEILQLAIPGLSLINTGFSLVFVIMFIFSNSFAESRLKNAESEIQDKSTQIEKNRLALIDMQNHTIESLSNLVQKREGDSGECIARTKEYVDLITDQLRKSGHFQNILTQDYVKLLERAVPVYDIGKIVVPDAILKKEAPLSPDEFEQLRRHASEGGRIIHEILDGYESPEYIRIASDIAAHHHEKWDGTGYPARFSGEAIPLCARIMALADSFDSMVAQKNHKAAMDYEEAFRVIEDKAGSDFDPTITREFLKAKRKAIDINERHKKRAKTQNAPFIFQTNM